MRRRAFADAAVLAANMAVYSGSVGAAADAFWQQAEALAAQSQSSDVMRSVAQQRADTIRTHTSNTS